MQDPCGRMEGPWALSTGSRQYMTVMVKMEGSIKLKSEGETDTIFEIE